MFCNLGSAKHDKQKDKHVWAGKVLSVDSGKIPIKKHLKHRGGYLGSVVENVKISTSLCL